MSRRTRIFLIALGLLLILFSLAAVIFAWTPVNVLSDQTPLAPTLFTLPPGGGP